MSWTPKAPTENGWYALFRMDKDRVPRIVEVRGHTYQFGPVFGEIRKTPLWLWSGPIKLPDLPREYRLDLKGQP